MAHTTPLGPVRRGATTAVTAILATLTLLFAPSVCHPVIRVEGDPTFKMQVEAALADMRATDPVGIDAILDQLEQSPNEHIIRRTDLPLGSTASENSAKNAKNGKGSGSFVTWEPVGTQQYPLDTLRHPIAALIHELSHAYDMDRGQLNRKPDKLSGISGTEMRAVQIENLYRRRKPVDQDGDGLPDVRTRYGELLLTEFFMPCVPATFERCLDGGLCGRRYCDPQGHGYFPCQDGEFAPAPEVCDDDTDNDCDGKIDCEDTECAAVIPCTSPILNDLGTFGGTSSEASAINNAGQVTGYALTPQEAPHVFLYSGGSMVDVGTLGDSSGANAINESGDIVGGYRPASGDYLSFLYHNGTLTDIGTLGSHTVAYTLNETRQIVGHSLVGGFEHAFLYDDGVIEDISPVDSVRSAAYDINDVGQVVGAAETGSDVYAFLYDNGVTTNLGTLGGQFSTAQFINSSGQVIGHSSIAGFGAPYRAFLYSGGRMIDLGTLGGSGSYALAISDNGHVVGWSYLPGDTVMHAFLYSNGVMLDLGTLGGLNSRAIAVNEAGDVVGQSDLAGSSYTAHAFLYRDGRMIDLGTLGGPQSQATAINQAGRVVGWALTAENHRHAFLY